MLFLGTRNLQCIKVRFASLLSGGFTTMAVINPLEKKLANRTSVQCTVYDLFIHNFTIKVENEKGFNCGAVTDIEKSAEAEMDHPLACKTAWVRKSV